MSHNLDVESYSLNELLGLFDLDPSKDATVEELKRAKRKVLMMHPDKSRLPKEYFLFYKKALDIVVRLYQHVHKVSQPVENTVYSANGVVDKTNSMDHEHFRKNLSKMTDEDFHKKFHTLFETHAKKPIDTERNAWFTSEEPLMNPSHTINTPNQMNEAIDKIKQRQQEMTLYKGVSSMIHHGGNSFYDDATEENDVEYVECDPFSKLKFDDVRKVHRDQVVIGVRESDFSQVPQYKTVEEYQRSRYAAGSVKPMVRHEAQKLMEDQERYIQEKIRQKQYRSEQETMRHIEMNKQVMSNFLHLGNG